jgi:acetyl esterase/lipase
MPDVDPELAALAEHLPRPSLADPAVARQRIHDMFAAGVRLLDRSWTERVDVENISITGPDNAQVPLRIYQPRGDNRRGAALVHFHGGAFVVGDLELSEPAASRYADKLGITVVDVDYRLAPEHPFPAGLDDSYAALCWVADHSDDLGIDPSRVAVGGHSAGGGLAAAVALAARDRGAPQVAFQLLLYPVLDDRLTTWSVREMVDTPMWDAPSTVHMWRHYLGDRAGTDGVSPYAAPARAADLEGGLRGLPPAYVLACGLDPLRDEDIDYAQRLMAAGVSVELHVVPGAFHGFDGFPATLSRRTTGEILDVLGRALA